MKLSVLIVLLLALSAAAQTRQVALTWNHQADPPLVTFNVYRLADACPTTAPTIPPPAPWVKVNSVPIEAKTYGDTVQYGSYCYIATAFSAGLESGPSNNTVATVAPQAPSGLQLVVATAQVSIAPDGTITGTAKVEASGRVIASSTTGQ